MEEKGKTSIFILPHKFQRKRLDDMKKAMQRENILFTNSLDVNVTHIVTEYESYEQVQRQVSKEGLELPNNALIVSAKWLIECLKASEVVPVIDSYMLKKAESSSYCSNSKESNDNSDWACQRGAKLKHFNNKLTDALEVLQEHAERRDTGQDYSRALAFRRASCVLKTLPFTLQEPNQLEGLKDIGGHVKRVIADILELGSSSEVEDIRNSNWFKKMKLFTSVFGVGPTTAKSWIERGWETIQDVRDVGCPSGDWRVAWGLAFQEDLSNPVLQQEADAFTCLVQSELIKIVPGALATLCGGFRRGKVNGHDVDILITHPEEGKEVGLLARLLSALEKKDFILIGHKEKNSYRSAVLYEDHKQSSRGQLDHFEKWLGICKFPKSYQTVETTKESANASDKHLISQIQNSRPCKHISNDTEDSVQNNETNICAKSDTCTEFPLKDSFPHTTHYIPTKSTTPSQSFDESLDEKYEPCFKKSKLRDHSVEREPNVEAQSERHWIARRVDLIVSPYSQYYYALVGWTGSKHFNRDARLFAQKVLSMKLTSHGIFDMKNQEALPAASEEEVFAHLKLRYRDPTDRNC